MRRALHTLDVVPTIVSLQDHLETIRQAEIDRVRGRMGQLTPEQEIAIEALTRGIINKVMHTPITTLKTAAKESEATTVVDVVRRLFNLQVKGKDAAAEPQKKDEVGTRHYEASFYFTFRRTVILSEVWRRAKRTARTQSKDPVPDESATSIARIFRIAVRFFDEFEAEHLPVSSREA